MCESIKRPPVVQGSTFVHRRTMSRNNTVYEQGYFTRNTAGKAKPEVQE